MLWTDQRPGESDESWATRLHRNRVWQIQQAFMAGSEFTWQQKLIWRIQGWFRRTFPSS